MKAPEPAAARQAPQGGPENPGTAHRFLGPYQRRERVRFGHCDPAGIVFYPRYFEMLNAVVEDWFTDHLGISYAELLGPRRVGLPSVHLAADFKRVSRMGDVLVQTITIERLGTKSLSLKVSFTGEGDTDVGPRAVFEQVLVCTSLLTHQSTPFPPDVRLALKQALELS